MKATLAKDLWLLLTTEGDISMKSFTTCRTHSSKKSVNTPLYSQSDEVLSNLVMRMAQMEQRIMLQRCEIGVLEAELQVLRNHAVAY